MTGAGNVCSPVTIELFALDCNTARGNNLLPNCHIEPKESDMINRGSFIARKAVANRWLEDFDNLNATTPNTCTQVLASLHVLGSRLRGAAPDETIKVIYITAWKEMDIAHDFELQTYRMLSKNEKEGGTYRFKWSVLEEMFRQLNDPGSQMRQITTNLKNTLAQLAPPSPKIYYLQGIQHHLKDDGGTNGEVQLAAFWDSLFSCAGLQRIGKNNLAECLQ